MTQTEYVFQNTEDRREFDRLRSIEAIFDPATRKRLLSAGLREGWRCLEVGPGAGSIMAWMSEKVGPSGGVTAVDLNARFLNNPPSNVRVLNGDIRAVALEPESFDLAHARYVLVHIPEFRSVLEKLRGALRPGGVLVLEEPDFSVSRALVGEESEAQSFGKVHRAIIHMYSSKGMDHAIGGKLPSLFQELGLKNLRIENDSPISQGGSGIAEMMRMSASQLKDKYMATGEATAEDIENYGRFARSKSSRAIYYATVSVFGQK